MFKDPISQGLGERDGTTLHVVGNMFGPGVHIVSSKTIAAAEAADAAPLLWTFGDLRRHDLEELAERLGSYGPVELLDYVEAIEQSVGWEPAGNNHAERLAALVDVVFDGTDEFPADGEEFRPDWEAEDMADESLRGYALSATSMSSDIPEDLFRKFASSTNGSSPAFSGRIDDHVAEEQIDGLIAALEARGYTVTQD